ncbi:MAG: DUF2911 domain-containing protein [Thermoanaerobaculia bacterium]
MHKPWKSAILAAVFAAPALGQQPQPVRLPQVSPAASIKQTVGVNDVTITFSRPGVKGRKIWGELVPYGKVWRTGANAATTIQFSEDVLVEGQPLPAGTYSLHTIPGEKEWTLIVNKEANQWGSYSYKPEQDAVRVKLTPGPGQPNEWMSFLFEDLTANSARVVLSWENLQVPFTIKNQTDTDVKVVGMLRESVAKAKPDDWQTLYRGANYLLQNKLSMDEAAAWLDKALAIKRTPQGHYAKARLLEATGKTREAVAELDKALEAAVPDTSPAFLEEIRNTKKTWSERKA